MNICVVGAGYVGIPTAASFAEYGNHVVCYDTDSSKIRSLNEGKMTIYEENLEQLVCKNVQTGNLVFSNSLSESLLNVQIVVICVGTPSLESGEADLTSVWHSATELSKCIENDVLVILKSTVPVGTTHKYLEILNRSKKNTSFEIDIAFCPEFIKQGSAVLDSLKPDRLVIGTDCEKTLKTMNLLYSHFNKNHSKTIYMSIKDAEMTKYVANSMLATRISFMNEISRICDAVKVDIENVRVGIGSDPRIGYSFLYSGIGFGGSCLPKDVRALMHLAKKNGIECPILDSITKVNTEQKKYFLSKIYSVFGKNLSGKSFACWGASFKPGTDDLREAPSIDIINEIVSMGGKVKVYDPFAQNHFKKWFNNRFLEDGQIAIADDMYTCLKNVECLLLLTEWNFFRNPDFKILQTNLNNKYIFDGRNQLDMNKIQSLGINYVGVGRS